MEHLIGIRAPSEQKCTTVLHFVFPSFFENSPLPRQFLHAGCSGLAQLMLPYLGGCLQPHNFAREAPFETSICQASILTRNLALCSVRVRKWMVAYE